MSELPELPQPVEGERPTPLERYSTQQLTTAVPTKELREPPTVAQRVAALAQRGVQRARGIPRRRLYAIGAGALLFVVVLAAALGGDSKAAPTGPPPSPLDGWVADPAPGDWMEAQLDAWRSAGLEPGGFADVDPEALNASACLGGAASAIEITLCDFPTAAAAAGAVTRAERLIGKHTGAVVSDGTHLLVIADRRAADRSGRTINKLVKSMVKTER